jgi:hypothetical protein
LILVVKQQEEGVGRLQPCGSPSRQNASGCNDCLRANEHMTSIDEMMRHVRRDVIGIERDSASLKTLKAYLQEGPAPVSSRKVCDRCVETSRHPRKSRAQDHLDSGQRTRSWNSRNLRGHLAALTRTCSSSSFVPASRQWWCLSLVARECLPTHSDSP